MLERKSICGWGWTTLAIVKGWERVMVTDWETFVSCRLTFAVGQDQVPLSTRLARGHSWSDSLISGTSLRPGLNSASSSHLTRTIDQVLGVPGRSERAVASECLCLTGRTVFCSKLTSRRPVPHGPQNGHPCKFFCLVYSRRHGRGQSYRPYHYIVRPYGRRAHWMMTLIFWVAVVNIDKSSPRTLQR